MCVLITAVEDGYRLFKVPEDRELDKIEAKIVSHKQISATPQGESLPDIAFHHPCLTRARKLIQLALRGWRPLPYLRGE
jgi:hypothetical protein